jgi:hypothetical protein
MFTNEQVIQALPTFAVSSAGAPDAIAPLTLQAAEQTVPLLARLAEMAGHPGPVPAPVQSFAGTPAARASAEKLKALLDHHGSDKAQPHDYHHLYGTILQQRDSISAVLEIGLGTNNVDVVSNMGPAGRPGASLRAFRDFLPNARIYGADVDRRILFREERIETFHVDQTDTATFDALSARLEGVRFDLVIDDGLHAPNANLATLAFGLPKLTPGGVMVVEDIHPAHLPVWHVVFAMLPQGQYSHFLAHAHGGILVAIQRHT